MRIIILTLVSVLVSGCLGPVLDDIQKKNRWYEQAHFDCFNAWGYLIYDKSKMIVSCLKTENEKPLFIRDYNKDGL